MVSERERDRAAARQLPRQRVMRVADECRRASLGKQSFYLYVPIFVADISAVASNAKFANANVWTPVPTKYRKILAHRDIIYATPFGNLIKNL